jgi:hypothetical protein
MHRIIAQAACGRANDRARVLPDVVFMLIDARGLRNASRNARVRCLLRICVVGQGCAAGRQSAAEPRGQRLSAC